MQISHLLFMYIQEHTKRIEKFKITINGNRFDETLKVRERKNNQQK